MTKLIINIHFVINGIKPGTLTRKLMKVTAIQVEAPCILLVFASLDSIERVTERKHESEKDLLSNDWRSFLETGIGMFYLSTVPLPACTFLSQGWTCCCSNENMHPCFQERQHA